VATSPFIAADLVIQGGALTAGRRESDIRQIVKRQLVLSSEYYVSEVKLATPIGATNNLRDSWDFAYDDQEQSSTIGPRAEYALPVELGRKPGRGIPLVPLTLWVKRKLGVSNPRQARSIAYLISRKAKRVGIKGQYFAGDTFDAALPVINANFISPIGALIVKSLGG
jgi:hypothetical protein